MPTEQHSRQVAAPPPRRPGGRAVLLAIAAALLVGFGIGFGLGQPRLRQVSPLPVISVTGCDELWADPDGGYRCGLSPETLQAAALSSAAEPDPHIEVRMQEPAGGFLVYSAPPPHGLRRHDGELTLSLPLSSENPDAVLQGTHYYLFGIRQLRLRLTRYVQGAAPPTASSSDPARRAALLNEQGKQLYDQGRTAEAIAAFEGSLALAEPLGQVSLAANSARHYAALLFRQSKDAEAAGRILDRYEPLLRLQAIEHAGATFERALYATSRGELARAQSFYREAIAEAVAVNYPELRQTVTASYVAFLHQQGDHAAAQKQAALIGRELAAQSRDDSEQPCARSRTLAVLARAQLNAAETVPALAQTARQTLDDALTFAKNDDCRDRSALLHIYSSAARAVLLLAEGASESGKADRAALAALLAEVEIRAGDALAITPALSPLQRMDLGEVFGRLAKLRGEYAAAIPLLKEVELLASRGLVAEPRYRALIALASCQDALARSTPDAARARLLEREARLNFETAEQLISDLVLFVPLPAARRGFLPRYESGLAAYLDFLLHRSDLREALAVMRRAQVRGLALTLQAGLLDPRTAAQAAALQRDANDLLESSLRRHNALQLADGSTPQSLQQQRQHLDEQLARLRQAGLGALPLRPLQTGEAMLICHALPQGRTACLYAVADGRTAQLILPTAELQALLATGDAQQQFSRRLLGPFAALIDHTRVLRIIPFPLLRSVEFAALAHPVRGDSLANAGRTVVYALDVDPRALPTQPPHRAGSREIATVVVYGHLASTAQVTPPLLSRLQALGWQPHLFAPPVMEHGYAPLRRLRCMLGLVNNCRHPLLPVDHPDLPIHPGSAASVLPGLQGVNLAHFYTHASFGGEGGGWESAIRMPDQGSLRAADLMRLTPSPRFSVLITCEGGQSGVGQEVDDISLAQALLLRGGEAVVAANQKLADAVGAAWTRALYDAAPASTSDGQAYLNAEQPDLRSAYLAAQLALKARSPAAADWTALRLYVH